MEETKLDPISSDTKLKRDALGHKKYNVHKAKAKDRYRTRGDKSYTFKPIKYPKRIRPWQREGFSSKKEWATMRKRINNLIWKNREVA